MRSRLDTAPARYSVDVVGVFTQDFKQVFPDARAVKAVIKEDSKTMDHPLETGSIITDHRIILPVEIELSVITQGEDYQDIYRNIRQYFLTGTLLTVQTRSGVYVNQLIAAMPHDEDPDQFNILVIAVKLKQVQFATAQFGIVPRQPHNASTVNRGVQQPAAPRPQSALRELFGSIASRT